MCTFTSNARNTTMLGNCHVLWRRVSGFESVDVCSMSQETTCEMQHETAPAECELKDETTLDGAGPGGSSSSHAAPSSEERSRTSRRLLSTSTSIPEEIKQKYTMRSDIVISHVVHKNNTLPHIQARLPAGEKFEGKQLNIHQKALKWLHVMLGHVMRCST